MNNNRSKIIGDLHSFPQNSLSNKMRWWKAESFKWIELFEVRKSRDICHTYPTHLVTEWLIKPQTPAFHWPPIWSDSLRMGLKNVHTDSRLMVFHAFNFLIYFWDYYYIISPFAFIHQTSIYLPLHVLYHFHGLFSPNCCYTYICMWYTYILLNASSSVCVLLVCMFSWLSPGLRIHSPLL